MATLASAQFWIRTDGADTNGGGYDSGIAGAATNYSDQAAAQDTFSLLTLATGTLTSTGTGTFTAAMLGNAVNVPGQGYYWITARTSNSVVTVTPGTGATTSFTTQPGKVGGALRNPSAFSTGASGSITPGTATPLVPGNQINIRASGSGSVGSPDYSQTGYNGLPDGDTTSGHITWVAYNGVPYYVSNGVILGGPDINYHKWYNIYFACNGTSNLAGNTGLFPNVREMSFFGCTIDGNNQTGATAVGSARSGSLIFVNCDIVGGGTSSSHGLYLNNYATVIKNCKVHGWGGYGIYETVNTAYTQVSNSAVYLNTGGGIRLLTDNNIMASVDGCTIDRNGGDGINIPSTLAAIWTRILNNNITTNGGYGINIAAGTAAANTAAIAYEDYNNFGSGATLNTSGQTNNLTMGAHDINVDPGYNNAAGGEFTPSNTSLIAAAPIGFA